MGVGGMIVPLVLVPVYGGALRFHITPVLWCVLWPVMHLSIARLLLHVVQKPYWIFNVRPVAWLGQISYSLSLGQQLFAYGRHHQPWYFVLLAVGLARALLTVWWSSRCSEYERGKRLLERWRACWRLRLDPESRNHGGMERPRG